MKCSNLVFILATGVLFSGCLKTRNDMKEAEQKQILQRQVVDLQKTNADSTGRMSEIDEQLRFLNGRLEVLENKSQQNDQNEVKNSKSQSENLQEMNKKVALLQEEVIRLEGSVTQLTAEVGALKAEHAAQAAREGAKVAMSESKRDTYQGAQDLFKQKDWQKAIIEYSKYRDKNPNGKYYADATYKIGVSFQEMGMKDDAKTFYQEVITRFPNTEDARRAKSRIKSLK